MASGKEHDRAIKLWILPFGLLAAVIYNLQIAFIFSFAFAVGGLWLSPDLDIISKPLKRWGFLQVLWWPYRKIIPHRSNLSHSPIIGTTIRLIYLVGILIIINLLLSKFINLEPLILLRNVNKIITLYPEKIIALVVGIEVSAWVHIIQDKYHQIKD
ncbi:metal-binding protein [Prochlorococcus sp. MIT 1223]|uniref:metal-binding protein n=1 Tax=Prochlorococcus sp. MIT 1223 TaxID=3096217 RepID=UPI002A7604F8|nr:metal-binding protein [Prochlorococcus sp. MIT 1223]